MDCRPLAITDRPDGCVIAVKAVPGASRTKVAGVLGDALKIAVAAAAEKGKANAALAKVLAQAVGADERSVQLISGQTNPRKQFLIVGMTSHQVRENLERR